VEYRFALLRCGDQLLQAALECGLGNPGAHGEAKAFELFADAARDVAVDGPRQLAAKIPGLRLPVSGNTTMILLMAYRKQVSVM
jgi:hypothetical protein